MASSVCFHGKYIPLQGVEYIVRAADLLRREDVEFTLIGGGQTFSAVQQLAQELELANITFIGKVPFEELPGILRSFDVGLGIFGDTDKATRVIPNKVYELAALGKPVITADTPAIREVFTDREDIILCRRADPEDLAGKISLCNKDVSLRARVGEGALRTFHSKATPKVIARTLLQDLAFRA